jgi:hypothetical protein
MQVADKTVGSVGLQAQVERLLVRLAVFTSLAAVTTCRQGFAPAHFLTVAACADAPFADLIQSDT